MTTQQWAAVTGIGHVRLTVTDIQRSKQFYQHLFGAEPMLDFSGQVNDPGVRSDPEQFYGGCVFQLGDQVVGLRPVADGGDRFDSTRVGLDHVSFTVAAVDDLRDAAGRFDAAGVQHGDVAELMDAGMAILSVQDPDDINVELTAPLS